MGGGGQVDGVEGREGVVCYFRSEQNRAWAVVEVASNGREGRGKKEEDLRQPGARQEPHRSRSWVRYHFLFLETRSVLSLIRVLKDGTGMAVQGKPRL